VKLLASFPFSRAALAALGGCVVVVAHGCSEAGSDGANGGAAGASADAGADVAMEVGADVAADVASDVAEDAAADAGSEGLGLLSLNLHCFIPTGSAYSDDLERFEAIAQGIAQLGAQVVTLQEACIKGSRDAAKDLATRLTELTGKTWGSSWQLAHVAWEGTADEAQEGVALLADRPLQDVRATHFAHQGGLVRVALSGELALPSGGLRVMSVHLDHQDAAVREEQARETGVAALAEAYPSAATIVAGDFNAKEGSPAHSALLQQGFLDASDPLSANRIDHVFVHRGAGWSAQQASLVFEGASAVSDHPGVLVRLVPESPPPLLLTRVHASLSLAAGEFASIRGSVAPLSWDRGWTLHHDESTNAWDFVSSELSGGFEYKLLKDDVVWQIGANQVGSAGNDHAASASF